jgi:Tol biopolymer transport system component
MFAPSYFSRENHLRILLIAMAGFVAASLLVIAVADPAQARKRHQAAPINTIVFTSDRDGTGGEIYKMKGNGTNPTRLTTTGGNSEPVFSANRTKIAFVHFEGSTEDIYVMNSDGSGQTNLTNAASGVQDSVPSISSDGTKIAFASFTHPTANSYNYDIYVMNSDGSGTPQKFTNGGNNYDPSISPDGTKVTFEGYDPSTPNSYQTQIYVADVGFSGTTRLTTSGSNSEPVYSPDSTKIAFAHDDNGSGQDIYVMNASGTGQTNLTNKGAGQTDNRPAFSPNGQKITFFTSTYLGGGGGNNYIYAMSASDGSGLTPLTTTATGGKDYNPVFSPDSTKIAFERGLDNDAEIYEMNASDGSSQIDLTNNSSARDTSPDWGGGKH